jgi:hypothetical protein
LLVGGKVVDKRTVSRNPPRLTTLAITRAADQHHIAWSSSAGTGDTHTYAVQASTDDGKTWTTVAVGLKSPQFHLDRSHVPGQQKVLVRVLGTDGFSTSVAQPQTLTLA